VAGQTAVSAPPAGTDVKKRLARLRASGVSARDAVAQLSEETAFLKKKFTRPGWRVRMIDGLSLNLNR
jgi:hypothetical protein